MALPRQLRLRALLTILLLCTLGLWGRQLWTRSNPAPEAQVRSVLHAFMQARLTRDDAKVRTFLANDFHKTYVSQPTASLIGQADPHYHRYRITSLTRAKNGVWIAHVQIEEHHSGFIPAETLGEIIELVRIDDAYRVRSVRSDP